MGIYEEFKKTQKNISFDEYISHIKKDYEADKIKYESLEFPKKNQYIFSTCFICQYPVIAYENKVLCVNNCFKYDVNTNIFNENFTLDNFNEDYKIFCKNHWMCLGEVKLLSIDVNLKKAYFLCEVCRNSTFDDE